MNRNKKLLCKRSLIILLAAMLLFSALPLSAAAASDRSQVIEDVSITVNGEYVHLEDPVRILDGRIFLPVAPLSRLFGATVEWDGDNEAVIVHTTNSDNIVMSSGVPVVYFNERRSLMDVAPFISQGRVYIPLRYVAGLMSSTVIWHAGEKLAELTAVESSEEMIGSIFGEADPFTEEDLLLLAKLVQVEAGYEPYEGQLGVANVILNRVKDTRFPNTIHDVIYSGSQFPPAHNGLLDKSKPSRIAFRAAKDALNGKNNVEDAVYFFNPNVSSGSFWDQLEVVVKIGNHRFAK